MSSAAGMRHGFPRLRAPRAVRVLERDVIVYRRSWLIIVSGFFEPVLYLLGIGFGVGSLVGQVHGQDSATTDYAVFVAPALMASSAMNGAIYETTFNLFFKLRYARTYDAMLSTPVGVADIALGEVAWAVLRGAMYSTSFIVVMTALGLVRSSWALAAAPAAVLIGFSFAACGAAVTTWVRSWQDFDAIQLVLLPLFLFSGTFYPLDAYVPALRLIVELTPLYHGVHLLRGLTTGALSSGMILDLGYLAVMGLLGMAVATRRMEGKLRR